MPCIPSEGVQSSRGSPRREWLRRQTCGAQRGHSRCKPVLFFATAASPRSTAAILKPQLGGSLLLIWGGRLAWLGAGALGVFTVLATLIAHAWWTKAGIERFRDFNTFWEHVGLVGGFMLAAVLASRRSVAQRP